MKHLKTAFSYLSATIVGMSSLTASEEHCDLQDYSSVTLSIGPLDSFDDVIRYMENHFIHEEECSKDCSYPQTRCLHYMIQEDGSIIVMPYRKATRTRNYYTSISSHEKKDIRYIITTLANDSLASIGTSRSSLKKAGERIDHIHPLRFLVTAFSDEELKVGIHAIRSRGGLVWDEFSSGLIKSLKEESSRQNIQPEFIQDFAAQLGLNTSLIVPPIQESRWKDLINLLIDSIPRANDPNRYHM